LITFDPNDEDKLRKTNIEGTANIVNLCIDFNVKKLCYVSSIAALGDLKNKKQKLLKNLNGIEVFHSDYAISKHGQKWKFGEVFKKD
jgi:thioester reductase-like protein